MIGDEYNFTKRKLAYESIRTFVRFQGHPYHFQPVPQIQRLFALSDEVEYDQDELYAQSLQNEPRGASLGELLKKTSQPTSTNNNAAKQFAYANWSTD
jgi:uncharacterized protein (DUF1697 family)